ncbi:Zn-ribbon domain-containing OB-fold protein [Actinophytocola sp.]|uniref:Zn-ribbon domain-containing OB-fold protein n=1 Tax=Actinophytocola sp. TaxID=1872138 RepID=UPI003D6A24FF
MVDREGSRALEQVVGQDESGRLCLIGGRCDSCGEIRYPYRELCPIDLGEMRRHALSGHGVVYEAVLVALAPSGFQAPYWVGYVDMAEGVRVFAPLAVAEGAPEPKHGDRVRVEFHSFGDGTDQFVRPVFHQR